MAYYCLADLPAFIGEDQPDSVDALYVLTPRDLETLEVTMTAAGRVVTKIPICRLGGWSITVGPLPDLQLVFGEVEAEPYWQLALRQSRGYLSLGATREAQIWINMAAENLIEFRIDQVAASDPATGERLRSGKLAFAEAEQTVRNARPELADVFQWPDRPLPPSRYAQLKELSRSGHTSATYTEVRSAYSKVTSGRNPLVHGRVSALPDAQVIADAIRALEWLIAEL